MAAVTVESRPPLASTTAFTTSRSSRVLSRPPAADGIVPDPSDGNQPAAAVRDRSSKKTLAGEQGEPNGHEAETSWSRNRSRNGLLAFLFLLDFFQQFLFGLAFDAELRERHRGQSLFTDLHAAFGAHPVSAFGQAGQRFVDKLALAVPHLHQ